MHSKNCRGEGQSPGEHELGQEEEWHSYKKVKDREGWRGFQLASPAFTNDITESDFRGVENGTGRTEWVGKKC